MASENLIIQHPCYNIVSAYSNLTHKLNILSFPIPYILALYTLETHKLLTRPFQFRIFQAWVPQKHTNYSAAHSNSFYFRHVYLRNTQNTQPSILYLVIIPLILDLQNLETHRLFNLNIQFLYILALYNLETYKRITLPFHSWR